jgi:hypothetical protein
MMRVKAVYQSALLISTSLAFSSMAFAEDADLKRMVQEALDAKDKTIAEMDKRLQKLEALTKEQQQVISKLQQEKQHDVPNETKPTIQAEGIPAATPVVTAAPIPAVVAAKAEDKAATASPVEPPTKKSGLADYFQIPSPNVDHADAEKTEIGGFMDVTAQSTQNDNQAFHVGVVELSLDRVLHKGDFAASAALDWFSYGTDPSVQIGAAFFDFHLYDERIPLRGRIFQEAGFHLQAGQFDLPFGSDYQFFAVRDRLTVTPPMTTTRIQQSGSNPSNGGFNSTGVRTYGQWENLSYAAYAVDSIFTDGMAFGGRLGFLVNDPYRLHKQASAPLFDAGLSVLLDMDNGDQTTDKVYAADVSFNYENVRLVSEFMQHDANENRVDDRPALDESGFHVTLITDLERWLEQPFYVYGRYHQWTPNYKTVEIDDTNYKVNRIPAVSFGLGYRFNEYLTLKAEYNDTMGHKTDEPLFQSQFGIVQLVGAF